MSEDATSLEIIVSPEAESQRIDQFLAKFSAENACGNTPEGDCPPPLGVNINKMSRTRWANLILGGAVMRNFEPCTKLNTKVKANDTISAIIPPPEVQDLIAENIPLEILYEDAHVIVINKPAGLVVHPAPGHWAGTLVNALLYHCGETLSGIGGVKRPGIVHRLDKDTSGVMVVAKTDKAHESLSAQFAAHGRDGQLQRRYIAFTINAPEQTHGTVDQPIGRDTHNRLKMAIKGSGAREAITHWECTAQFGTHSAQLECELETGRTHQIRVHMAHMNMPIIGDPLYGHGLRTRLNLWPEPAKSAALNFPRQALHAAILGFTHPTTGEAMHFETPLPQDMIALREALTKLN